MVKKLLFILLVFPFLSCQETDKKEVNSSQTEHSNNKQNSHTHDIPKADKKKLTDRSVVITGGKYSEPCMCKSGDLIYLEKGGSNLMLLSKNSAKPIHLLKEGKFSNNVAWSKKCDKIYFKEKQKDYSIVIKSIDITSKEIKSYNYPALSQLKSLTVSDTLYFLDKKTLQIKGFYNKKEWSLTKGNEKFYQISVSPNGKYIAAHSGANVFLYSTSGGFIRNLGLGIASDWSPNSKFLIGFKDESNDGHSISNSDLYLYDISKETPVRITNTKNSFESWPSYKDEKTIIFSDMLKEGIYSKTIK